MFQTVALFLLLINSCFAEIEILEPFSFYPGFCYQGICDDICDPESILRGPVYQLGNFDDCLYRRKQQYCLTHIQLCPGDTPSDFWFHIQNMTSVRTHFQRDLLYVGICVPESSTAEDVSMTMYDMLEPAAASLGVHVAIKVEPRNCQTRHRTAFTNADVVFGVALLAIVTAVIVGTVYDSQVFKKHQCDEENTTAQKALLCFSLMKNWKTIEASKSSRNLDSIEGIRVIISFVAILLHAGYFTLIGALANMDWLEESYNGPYKLITITLHFPINLFISMGGFLTGYNASRRMDGREFTFVHYIKMVLHRSLRYAPIYVVLIAFSSTWLNYFGSGPLWPSLVTSEVENCRRNWWINALYLNNYINVDTLCMLHSWYIASDFQNYVVFLFALMMIYKYQKWSRIISGFLLFTFITIPFLQTYIERLDPAFPYLPRSLRHAKENPTFQRNYISFQGNAAPYFIGVIFGCVFFKMVKERTTLSKEGIIGFRTLSFALPIGTMLIFSELNQPEYVHNILATSLYAALHRPAYALWGAIIYLGCCTGHGWIFRSIFSWKGFQVISPFTYGIYLTHFILQRISAGNLKEPVTVSLYYLVNKAVVDFFIAFVLSVVLHLCVQLPVENLCKLKTNLGCKTSGGENNNSALSQKCAGISAKHEHHTLAANSRKLSEKNLILILLFSIKRVTLSAMIQTLRLFVLLIYACYAQNAGFKLPSVDPSYCYHGICDDVSDPESILRGPVYQLGNFEDCLYRTKQQYCLTNIQFYPEDTPSDFWFHLQNMTAVRTHYRRDLLYVGICVPESSTAEDVSMTMYDMLEPAAASLGVHVAIKVEPRNCQTRHWTHITTGDVVFGVVLLAILAAVIAGTIFDSAFFKKENDTVQEVLLCFSLIRNWNKIETSKRSRNLASVEGIRTICSFVAVFFHAEYFSLIGPIANMEHLEKYYINRYDILVAHLTTHIVTFVCMSGFITGYVVSRHMDGRKFTLFSYIKMIGHFYLRYTPIYVVLIAFSSTWLNYLGSGPLWPSLVTSEVQNCRQNWWINMLYLNNYINVDTLCMLHSWYIASDFQNFAVSLLVLMMFYKYPKWSRIITGFLLFIFIIIPFLQTYIERLDATALCTPEKVVHIKETPTFQRSYISFHGNAAPYFIGVIFGCVVFKMIKEGTPLSKTGVVAAWILSLGLTNGCMFTFYELYRPDYEYSRLAISLYAALHKSIYAVGIGTILLGCCTGHGWIFCSLFSWKGFQVISPFTYGIYLTHFILQRISAGNLKEPVAFSINNLINKAILDFLIALALSVALHLCVQLPVENLRELKIYSGHKTSSVEKNNSALRCKSSEISAKEN